MVFVKMRHKLKKNGKYIIPIEYEIFYRCKKCGQCFPKPPKSHVTDFNNKKCE